MELNLGALEVGTLINSVLFGVTIVQVYMYWRHRFNDGTVVKWLVVTIWTLEICDTLFLWVYIYRLTVTFYGIPSKLGESSWEVNICTLFDGIIGGAVQAFFAYRVLVVSGGNRLFPMISWSGCVLQFVGLIAIASLLFLTTLEEFGSKYSWMVRGVLVTDVIVDIVNTAALCYYLSKGRTGFHATDHIVDTIILWTVETGLATTIVALVILIFNFSWSDTAMWIGVALFRVKLYSNSFLAVLNGRAALRGNGVMTIESSRSRGERLEISVLQERDIEIGPVPQLAFGKDIAQKYQSNS